MNEIQFISLASVVVEWNFCCI